MIEAFLQQVRATGPVEWLGFATGVAGVWLAVRENILSWPVLIVCYAAYIGVAWQAQLAGALLMNVVFAALCVYGWRQWARGEPESDASLKVRFAPARERWAIVAVWAAGALVLGAVISTDLVRGWLPPQETATRLIYLDAFATTGGFVAQWLMARKYMENWIAWTISDLCFIWLWVVQGFWVSVLLFVIFILLAIDGWIAWNRSMNRRNAPASNASS